MTYSEVMARVADSARRVGRDPGEVTIVAVSKTFPVERIEELYDAGHRDFGENRAQDMAEKAARLPGDIRWHFVGALQSNKARLIRPTVHLLHSLDRHSLIATWLKGPGRPPPVLVQVNVGHERQKAGVEPAAAAELVDAAVVAGIEVKGLMAIPPIPELPEDSRPYFADLRRLRDSLADTGRQVTELSMGMTDDYEVAIEEGASIIRVGRAIFGARS